jgi:hypothetical protein
MEETKKTIIELWESVKHKPPIYYRGLLNKASMIKKTKDNVIRILSLKLSFLSLQETVLNQRDLLNEMEALITELKGGNDNKSQK